VTVHRKPLDSHSSSLTNKKVPATFRLDNEHI